MHFNGLTIPSFNSSNCNYASTITAISHTKDYHSYKDIWMHINIIIHIKIIIHFLLKIIIHIIKLPSLMIAFLTNSHDVLRYFLMHALICLCDLIGKKNWYIVIIYIYIYIIAQTVKCRIDCSLYTEYERIERSADMVEW